MERFILGRLLQGGIALFGITTVLFVLLRLSPGDPAVIWAGDNATPEQVQAIRVAWGFDQPLPVQYLRYVGNLASFGRLSCITLDGTA